MVTYHTLHNKTATRIVQGDFNARTNVNDNTITCGKYDPVSNENYQAVIPSRNSEDKAHADHRGKELIELCKSLGLATLNGRKIVDLFGNFTSFQWNGNRVVDYVIADQSISPSISFFEIGDIVPWLSDHCALGFKLESSVLEEKFNASFTLDGEKLDSFFWNSDSPEKFVRILKHHEQEISGTMTSSGTNVLEEFQKVVENVIEEGKFKNRRKKPSNDAIWFDSNCKKAKDEAWEAGKRVQSTPFNHSLRQVQIGRRPVENWLERKNVHTKI